MNRDEFEKWMVSEGRGDGFSRFESPNIEMGDVINNVGDYHSAWTQSDWEVWQACSRLYAKLTAEPTPGAMTLPGDFFSKGK